MAESDEGPPSPVVGLAAGGVAAPSLSILASASGGGRWYAVLNVCMLKNCTRLV